MKNIVMPSSCDTIPKRVQFLSENHPDRELFVFYRGEVRDPYTSRQLFRLAGKFANRLRHQYGFHRHDIIVNTLPNSPERLVTDLGIAMAGCTCMNGQVLLADGCDFLRSAKTSTCRAVILRPEEDSSAWRLLKQFVTGDGCSDVAKVSCDETPVMTSAILVSRNADGQRTPFLENLNESVEDVFLEKSIEVNDLSYVFVTSGSTGYSKLVPRTHAEIFLLVDSNNDAADTVLYNDRNLGWVAGFPYATYINGQKRVLQDWFDGLGRKLGKNVWTAICVEKCSMAILRQIDVDIVLKYVESIGGSDFKVKTLGAAGQPLIKAQFSSLFLVAEKVVIIYASTEGGILATATITSPDVGDYFCGKPAPGLQLKVVDEHAEVCKPRQLGTVLVKGGCVFKGYFNRLQDPDPNTSKCFTKDGWFDTEDVGFLDEAGNVYVMGRNKDTIMYGSVVLYPGWMEARIMQHPDVTEACVVPVSDPVIYQNLCACVKTDSGSGLNEDSLKAFCESMFVADLANEQTPMPKYFMVLENFPVMPTGKTDI